MMAQLIYGTIQTGECQLWVIWQLAEVQHINFSPTDPKYFITIGIINSCTGTPIVAKSDLYLMALVLPSPQMELSLFHAMGQLSQSGTLVLGQL
jgi:hypothetical protein